MSPIPLPLSPAPARPNLVGLAATNPQAIRRADYLARLMRHQWEATDDAATDEFIELEALRAEVDADCRLWNSFAPAGFCELPEEVEFDGTCDVCAGTGEGRHEGASCTVCRGRGFVLARDPEDAL